MQSNMSHRHDNQVENSVENFFGKFDYIFTLNQDSFSTKLDDRAISHQRNSESFLRKRSKIFYIELHGSYDWKDVFILGSNKEEEIQSRTQIKKFHDFFEESLCENGSKLVIVCTVPVF